MEWPYLGRKKSDKKLCPFKQTKFEEAILEPDTNFEPNNQILRKQSQKDLPKAKGVARSLITPDLCKLSIYAKQINP